MSDALKQNGRLVIDYLNVPYAEKRLIVEEEKEIDGFIYHIHRWMNESHFYKRISIKDHSFSDQMEFIEQVSKFSLDQFEYMLALHNLEIEQLYGDYQLNPYDREKSPRLIIVAQKIA